MVQEVTDNALSKTGVEDEVQGATEPHNSDRQIRYMNMVYPHRSQGKELFKRADSNVNLFQLLILQVIL